MMKNIFTTCILYTFFGGIIFAQNISGFNGALDSYISDINTELSKANTALETGFSSALDNSSETVASQVPFSIGSGNNVSQVVDIYPGIKLGLGMGLSVSTFDYDEIFNSFNNNIDNINLGFSSASTSTLDLITGDSFESIINLVYDMPIPYYSVYFKMGLPEINDIFRDFPVDFGVRLGVVPNIASYLPTALEGFDLDLSTAGFNVGVEARMRLFEAGFFYSDFRISADYSYRDISFAISILENTNGNISATLDGTADGTYISGLTMTASTASSIGIGPSINYSWNGFVVSPRIFAGVELPYFGSIYIGSGIDLNFGYIDTSLSMSANYDVLIDNVSLSGSSSGLTQEQEDAIVGQIAGNRTGSSSVSFASRTTFNAIDIRFIGGVQIFFINISIEYGILSEYFAITVCPFALKF